MVEAYKAYEGYCQEKLIFAKPNFPEGMDNTKRRVTKCYTFLNLDFLDEEDQDEGAFIKGVPAPRHKSLGPKESPVPRPPEPFMSFFLLFVSVPTTNQSCRHGQFVKPSGSSFLSTINEIF